MGSTGENILLRIKRKARELTTCDIWNVGLVTLAAPLATLDDLRLRDVRWLPPQPPYFYIADPFPYRLHGRDRLLVERYGHPKGVNGIICGADVTDGADGVSLAPAIVRDRHISYPYTFEADGQWYCAPEMNQESGCVIYRLDAEGSWRPAHHILQPHRIVDPTLFRFDERWWLFCTEPPPLHNSVLHAYYAETIAGPWAPHANNPLKRDATSARPAGRPFSIGSRLFRPAQDCSATYGGAVSVMEIQQLTPDRFAETRALRLEPDPSWPYPDGLHHLVVDGVRVYFDAKKTYRDYLLFLKLALRR